MIVQYLHSCIYGLAVHLIQKLVGTLFNVPVRSAGRFTCGPWTSRVQTLDVKLPQWHHAGSRRQLASCRNAAAFCAMNRMQNDVEVGRYCRTWKFEKPQLHKATIMDQENLSKLNLTGDVLQVWKFVKQSFNIRMKLTGITSCSSVTNLKTKVRNFRNPVAEAG